MFASTTTEVSTNFHVPGWHWIVLVALFASLILGDLAVHRKAHIQSLRSATIQSLAWVGLATCLGLIFWPLYGASASAQYFTGYLIEQSLSIDNVFAWSVILSYFAIPKKYQHRVLFWGIFGAIVMRAIFIFAGIAIIERFEPILLVFGAILLYSGWKLVFHSSDHEFDPGKSKTMALFKRLVPISHKRDNAHFTTIENGKKVATIALLALVAVEITDAIFAVDSVPAILAVSRDPFIVFSSNVAAILGLRSFYFVFDKIKERFWLLNKCLGLLLIGVGIKMVIGPEKLFGRQWFGIHVPNGVSLASIGIFLAVVVSLSLILKPRDHS